MFFETTLTNLEHWNILKGLEDQMYNWCFRGQANSLWKLSTTLERPFIQNTNSMTNPLISQHEREKTILYHFKKAAYNYTSKLPRNINDDLEWLSLIQHYGGMTRLLDFTRSFFIAAYFAINTDMGGNISESYMTIWAVNLHELEKQIDQKFELKHSTEEEKDKNYLRIANNFIRDNKSLSESVLCIEASRLNERMSLQRGLFLFPCDIEKPIEYNLCKTFDSACEEDKIKFDPKNISDIDIHVLTKCRILKINISSSIHKLIFKDLIKMNITSATLFPGLEGFTKSIGQYLYGSGKI